MSFWGLVFTEGRQRKEIGQPQSWSAHPPRRGPYPRSRAKTGTRKNTVSQTKVITCPYFISSSQKQCFPGLEKCHILLPFPKATAATFHHCTWVTGSLLREDELWDFTFLLPTPRGYTALAKEEGELCKGPLITWGSQTVLISLVPDLQKLFWSDPKVQKASGYLQLNENFKHVAPGLPQSIIGAWLAPQKKPSKST